jgi:hypothetical protein
MVQSVPFATPHVVPISHMQSMQSTHSATQKGDSIKIDVPIFLCLLFPALGLTACIRASDESLKIRKHYM